jgi:hypothetical protein
MQCSQQHLSYSDICANAKGPRRLKRGSSVIRLQRFQVWIPPGHECVSLESVICCHAEVFTSGWSAVQTSLAECGSCEWDRETSKVWIPWPTRGCRAMENSHDYHVPSYELSCNTFHTIFTFSRAIFYMTLYYVRYYLQHHKHAYMQITATTSKL